jgi:hypothetical protein
MKRNEKIILIIVIIGFILFKYLDTKYFEGFWSYLAVKAKNIDILPKYQKYIPLRNMLTNLFILISIIGGVIVTVYWNIKIKNKK